MSGENVVGEIKSAILVVVVDLLLLLFEVGEGRTVGVTLFKALAH